MKSVAIHGMEHCTPAWCVALQMVSVGFRGQDSRAVSLPAQPPPTLDQEYLDNPGPYVEL